jgi:hypothetical protein
MASNERGQAAIFVALLFNVLFVFFAMAVNIGLVVHDKINLQNSVDLAAYYAASKQAELLNVIAHENYAVRQSYKLLAWRYRVLGTMGLYQAGVVHPVWSGAMDDTAFPPAVTPSLCITYKPTWQEVPDGENLCNRENLRIPPLPEVQVIAPFLGLNIGIAALSRQLRQQFDIQCQKHGAYNWWFAMNILTAFRVDQANRKGVMRALAKNLSSENILDLDGNSIQQGARETFIKNLTFANRQSFDSGGGNFEMFNSLNGVDSKTWLPDIDIIPTLIYTDVDNAPGCNASPQPVQNLPVRPGAVALLNSQLDPGGKLQALRNANYMMNADLQYAIGVEKNPWYMIYAGIKAETNPRQIFFPFGSGVKMTARAFAKPFGGRIGPWYQAKWEKGNPSSDGDLVDPLMAPRVLAGGLLNSQQDPRRLPNYSRYPGDNLGVSSSLAINALTGMSGLTASFDSYAGISADMVAGADNDPMAWLGGPVDIRNFEIAAISPDLFDITYYSVESDFTRNYLQKLQAQANKLGIQVPVRADLGANGTGVPYSVKEQLQLSNPRQKPEAYYFVRNKAHLLTAWLPAIGAFNYKVGEAIANFGKCRLPDDGLKFPNPGNCVAGGGRTGYSTKLVGRDALKSSQHKIGGTAAANSINNPPPSGW